MAVLRSLTDRWRDRLVPPAWLPRIRHALRTLRPAFRPTPRPHHPLSIATGDDRIYHIHLRKTGGTSLNHIFLGVGAADPDAAYQELSTRRSHCCEWNGFRYAGWNLARIMEGDYFYAFSHAPAWQLHLPERTFTVTCFRDPVARVLSHYWMLRNYAEDATAHPCMRTEARWLGACFEDFLERIPAEHLKAQLWAFSSSFEVSEALDRVRHVSHVMFTEDFAAGLQRLEQRLAVRLPYRHCRTSRRGDVPSAALAKLRVMLADEYDFLSAVRSTSRSET